ncbi:hypothetical protein GJAV_G00167640 [Gymnothorax javanicus]|nr:hypothetical protein GJAV_G00167640 [Gymnothorax javanicus]
MAFWSQPASFLPSYMRGSAPSGRWRGWSDLPACRHPLSLSHLREQHREGPRSRINQALAQPPAMKTAGLTSLLLLSLLMTRTAVSVPFLESAPLPATNSSSTTGSPTDSRDSGAGTGTATLPARPTVTSDGKPTSEMSVTTVSSVVTKPVTTTSSGAPKLSSETKPTDGVPTVSSTVPSLSKKTESSPSTKLTGETARSIVTVVTDVNKKDPAESVNSTGKSQSQETGPTKEVPTSPKAPGPTIPISNTTEGKPGGPSASPDKKMLWILLPVLMVLVAGVIFVLKKYTKGHAHTDTTENGMENASFQSRSDSNKDGVMLLGVKTSAGEENAAAR